MQHMISYYLYVTLHYLINLKTYTGHISAVSLHLQVICKEGREREGETDKQTNKKDRQTDGQMDGQTDTETE